MTERRKEGENTKESKEADDEERRWKADRGKGERRGV